MSEEARNAQVVRRLAELWNAGDFDAVFDLYADDVVLVTAPEWPDPGPVEGKEAVVRFSEEWRGAWDTSDIDIDRIESIGDHVVVGGAWDTRGAASGVDGRIPFGIVFKVRDGLIAALQWFMDPLEARRAAGLA